MTRKTEGPKAPRSRLRGLAIAALTVVGLGIGLVGARHALLHHYVWFASFGGGTLTMPGAKSSPIDRREFEAISDDARQKLQQIIAKTPMPQADRPKLMKYLDFELSGDQNILCLGLRGLPVEVMPLYDDLSLRLKEPLNLIDDELRSYLIRRIQRERAKRGP